MTSSNDIVLSSSVASIAGHGSKSSTSLAEEIQAALVARLRARAKIELYR